jgi:hypothetical protein
MRWMTIIKSRDPSEVHQDWLTNVGFAFETIGRAFQISVFPIVQRAQQGLISVNAQGSLQIAWPYALLGTVGLALIVLLMLATRRKLPQVAWGCALYILALAPTANIIRTHLACVFYERFLFLPLLGLALATVGMASIPNHRPRSWYVAAAVLVPLFGLWSVKSNARTLDYTDPVRFWRHEMRVNPLSTIAPMGLFAATRMQASIQESLALLASCHEHAIRRGHYAKAARCAFDGAVWLTDTTLDLDQSSLLAAANFFRATANPASNQRAKLEVRGAVLSADMSNPAQIEIAKPLRGESLAVLAAIESRVTDSRAAADARAAIAQCPQCLFVPRAAKAMAAAGYAEESLKALDALLALGALASAVVARSQILEYVAWRNRMEVSSGPAKTHAEAQAFLSIGLYGAAYRVLVPHILEFEQIPEVSREFAQIAVRAGDTATARKILLLHMSPREAETQIAEVKRQRDAVGSR